MKITKLFETIDAYNSVIKQRETEVLDFSKTASEQNMFILRDFYILKRSLENHFDLFEKNKSDVLDIYMQYKKQYKQDLKAYTAFIKQFKELNLKSEALQTRAHVQTVKTGVNDDIKDLIIKPVPNCSGYSFFFKALALKVW